jgi:hypothetical protein
MLTGVALCAQGYPITQLAQQTACSHSPDGTQHNHHPAIWLGWCTDPGAHARVRRCSLPELIEWHKSKQAVFVPTAIPPRHAGGSTTQSSSRQPATPEGTEALRPSSLLRAPGADVTDCSLKDKRSLARRIAKCYPHLSSPRMFSNILVSATVCWDSRLRRKAHPS